MDNELGDAEDIDPFAILQGASTPSLSVLLNTQPSCANKHAKPKRKTSNDTENKYLPSGLSFPLENACRAACRDLSLPDGVLADT